MKFINKLTASLDGKKSHVCVGLDSRYDRIPDIFKKNVSVDEAIFQFNKHIIETTQDIAVAYKMNLAFYGGFGAAGYEGLRRTNELLKTTYPTIPTLADCKRSEMGESVKLIENEIFKWLLFDCVMVTPWFGYDTIKDYLKNEENGVCVYVHDSNPTAAEFQELELADGSRLYEAVTKRIVSHWNTNGNIFVEAGATYPDALKKVRGIVGEEMPILTAGIGAQGADPTKLHGVFGRGGRRFLANSSRGIIFAGEGASDYFTAVRQAAEIFQKTLWDLSLS